MLERVCEEFEYRFDILFVLRNTLTILNSCRIVRVYENIFIISCNIICIYVKSIYLRVAKKTVAYDEFPYRNKNKN